MAFECAANFQLGPDEIALVVHRGSLQRHVGFLFRSMEGKNQFLHLAFHKRIKFEDFPPEECSIAGKLPLERIGSSSLKVALQRIGRSSRQKPVAIEIPFGVSINTEKGSFNSKGIYKTPLGADGLTCATFVAEVCRGIGIDLLDESSWQPREEDAQWIDEVCGLLEVVHAEQAHVDHVRRSFQGLRIRPEEVAASVGLWKGEPLPFREAEAGGEQVVRKLAECCPPQEVAAAG